MAIGALVHLATTSGGAILGGVMRFLSDNARDRRADKEMQHDHLMALSKVKESSTRAARKDADKPISSTRRFAVILILSAVVAMMFVGGLSDSVINVPIESEGFSIFGFVFGGGVSYEQLSGYVIIPEVLIWGNAIISMLFGSNIVKR